MQEVYTCFPVRRELKRVRRTHSNGRFLCVYTCFPVRRELKQIVLTVWDYQFYGLHVLSRSEGIETRLRASALFYTALRVYTCFPVRRELKLTPEAVFN